MNELFVELLSSNSYCYCVFTVPIEDPLLRDCSDYFSEAMAREELYGGNSGNSESRSGTRPLTVIVYQNGDQINLYRIVDRESASPLSESLRLFVYFHRRIIFFMSGLMAVLFFVVQQRVGVRNV